MTEESKDFSLEEMVKLLFLDKEVTIKRISKRVGVDGSSIKWIVDYEEYKK